MHTCHANECKTRVPPRMLMCLKHWCKVPKRLQAAVWKHYVPGQEMSKQPTAAYLNAAADAVEAVAREEGIPIANPFRDAFLTSQGAQDGAQ